MPNLATTVLNDLEGNLLDPFGRRLYKVIGEVAGFDGEWLMKDLTPFPSNYRWDDVTEEAHLIGSQIAGQTDLHAPCVDVDFPVIQKTYRQLDDVNRNCAVAWFYEDGQNEDGLRYAYDMLHELGMGVDFKMNKTRREVEIVFADHISVHVMRSSTKGNHHLYINSVTRWDDYEQMLLAFVEAGICSQAYVYFSRHRQETHLRLPGVNKSDLKLTSSKELRPRTEGRGDTVRSMGRAITEGTVPTTDNTRHESFRWGEDRDGTSPFLIFYLDRYDTIEESVRETYRKRFGSHASFLERYAQPLGLDGTTS